MVTGRRKPAFFLSAPLFANGQAKALQIRIKPIAHGVSVVMKIGHIRVGLRAFFLKALQPPLFWVLLAHKLRHSV